MIIEPISREHSRELFDCGDEEVNRFLREQALQDHEKDMSRTMVLIDDVRDLDTDHRLSHPGNAAGPPRRHPKDRPMIKRTIPVVLLGQLGVDRAFQGSGLGELLLMDAQSRVDEISRRTGIRAMMLDARNERLARWYEQHDFVRFPGQLRMFKSIAAIPKLNLRTKT